MVVHYDSMNRICRFKGEIPVKLLLCYHGPRKNAISLPRTKLETATARLMDYQQTNEL